MGKRLLLFFIGLCVISLGYFMPNLDVASAKEKEAVKEETGSVQEKEIQTKLDQYRQELQKAVEYKNKLQQEMQNVDARIIMLNGAIQGLEDLLKDKEQQTNIEK